MAEQKGKATPAQATTEQTSIDDLTGIEPEVDGVFFRNMAGQALDLPSVGLTGIEPGGLVYVDKATATGLLGQLGTWTPIPVDRAQRAIRRGEKIPGLDAETHDRLAGGETTTTTA